MTRGQRTEDKEGHLVSQVLSPSAGLSGGHSGVYYPRWPHCTGDQSVKSTPEGARDRRHGDWSSTRKGPSRKCSGDGAGLGTLSPAPAPASAWLKSGHLTPGGPGESQTGQCLSPLAGLIDDLISDHVYMFCFSVT